MYNIRIFEGPFKANEYLRCVTSSILIVIRCARVVLEAYQVEGSN